MRLPKTKSGLINFIKKNKLDVYGCEIEKFTINQLTLLIYMNYYDIELTIGDTTITL